MLRVIIFEDNAALRGGLERLLESAPDIQLVASFADARSAATVVVNTQPDVVLMDIDMPGISGIEAVRLILNVRAETSILMLTVFEDGKKISEALRAGASG